MKWDGSRLFINNAECVVVCTVSTPCPAPCIGDERGASILCGAKAPVVDGAQMGSLLVPFVPVEAPLHRSQRNH